MTKEEYKSKLVWLREIPKSWEIKPLWSVSTRKTTTSSEGELLSVYLDRGVIRATEGILGTHAPSADLSNYQSIDPGDFILNNQQAWRGSVGVSFGSGIISPAYIVLALSKKLDWKYANYLLRSKIIVDQFMLASQGVGSIQRQVHGPSFKNILVLVPPLKKQEAIGMYLDKKIDAIDKIVEKKEKLIELLHKENAAFITRAVTKGLDQGVSMKDSGLEWVGKMPKNWAIRKLRSVLRSGIVDGPHETPQYIEEGIPFISVDSIDEDEGVNLDVVKKFISEEQYNEYNKKTKLTEGDILFTKAASIGKVAIVDRRRFMTWSPLAIIKPDKNIVCHKYLFYILKSNAFLEYVKNNCNLNTQLNIGMKILERSIVVLPETLDEQNRIVNYLDTKTATIRLAIKRIEENIKKLEEYRSSLIYSAVTGKIKI